MPGGSFYVDMALGMDVGMGVTAECWQQAKDRLRSEQMCRASGQVYGASEQVWGGLRTGVGGLRTGAWGAQGRCSGH